MQKNNKIFQTQDTIIFPVKHLHSIEST